MRMNRFWLLTVLLAALTGLFACGSTPVELESSTTAADDSTETSPKPSRGDSVREELVVSADRRADRSRRLTMRMAPPPSIVPTPKPRENYHPFDDNPVKLTHETPVSTFSVDVDTASYANVRRMLNEGRLPVHDAVRIEEMINYFDYGYDGPDQTEQPFNLTAEVAPSPWRDGAYLMQVGIKGFRPEPAFESVHRRVANLVFLIDVSGSMGSPDKLELLKQSMKLLTRKLGRDDRVAIAVYAGSATKVLGPTAGTDRASIDAAIERLQASGSTNGGAGIELAYALAQQRFVTNGINRVILATDGDFNVGTTDFEQLLRQIKGYRETHVSLTTLGFGTGNYNDHLMEQLAAAGNGNYFYIDSLREGHKVLVEELAGTLQVIAKDVKIQVEFNPRRVQEYRLIGYENRQLRRQDFNDDRVDAGDIGAGHTVTAIYEIALVGGSSAQMDSLRYKLQPTHDTAVTDPQRSELAFLKLRYKAPDGGRSRLMSVPVTRSQMVDDLALASGSFRFAAAVAGFGQLLRGQTLDEQLRDGELSYAKVHALAANARGADPNGYRGEFLGLVRLAQSLGQLTNARN